MRNKQISDYLNSHNIKIPNGKDYVLINLYNLLIEIESKRIILKQPLSIDTETK